MNTTFGSKPLAIGEVPNPQVFTNEKTGPSAPIHIICDVSQRRAFSPEGESINTPHLPNLACMGCFFVYIHF